MSEIGTYSEVLRLNYDPTHTTSLRNAFSNDVRRRFKELKKVIIQAVVVQDCFGFRNKVTALQLTTPGAGAFNFLRDPAKAEAFLRWLKRQEERGILTTVQIEQIGHAVNDAWINLYILDSYKRGIMRARWELQRAGIKIPESNTLDVALGSPFHIDRIGLIYTRAYSELIGITTAMDSLISQVLSQGMIEGDSAALMARKMISVIDGSDAGTLGITDKLGRFIPAERRAVMLARTETIRAFHLAAIQEYRNWGVAGVFVKAEWQTAGDDHVCPTCASMEGKVFTLDEIEPLIPNHPNCRCIALPYIEDIVQYYK
jgi:SPP1 gp7 family putative phage head morphogenesis protein